MLRVQNVSRDPELSAIPIILNSGWKFGMDSFCDIDMRMERKCMLYK